MFSAHVLGLPNPWHALVQKPTWKNTWLMSMATVIALDDVARTEKPCGKVCLSSYHPIKLVPAQIYV